MSLYNERKTSSINLRDLAKLATLNGSNKKEKEITQRIGQVSNNSK